MVRCQRCAHDNSDEKYFCNRCGAFLYSDSVKNKAVIVEWEEKFKKILNNLQELPHSEIKWNSVVDKYVSNIEKCYWLYQRDELKEHTCEGLRYKMEDFLDVCKFPECQIAFVGTIKTGKSTLINALLGRNYASMSVTSETAALAKFRSSEKDYIKLTFYTEKEWDKLWKSIGSGADKFVEEYKRLNAAEQKDKWIGHDEIIQFVKNADIEEKLKPWTSSQFPEHYFVKEVEVGISNFPYDFPPHVVFVDTPGLSDPVAYRSEITRNYIRRANAVFVCVEAQKLQQAELETLWSVFSFSKHNKKKVHIIATHWDALNNPETDWEKQRNYMYDQLTGKDCYDEREMAESNITYSSAYIHNLCRDYDQLQSDEQATAKISMIKFLANYVETLGADVFTKPDQFKDFMIEKANILNIYKIIQERLVYNYKSVLFDDLTVQYNDIQHNLKRASREAKALKFDLLQTAKAEVEYRRKKVIDHENGCRELRKHQDQLISCIKKVETHTQNNIKEILKIMDGPSNPNYLKKAVDKITTITNKILGD